MSLVIGSHGVRGDQLWFAFFRQQASIEHNHCSLWPEVQLLQLQNSLNPVSPSTQTNQVTNSH